MVLHAIYQPILWKWKNEATLHICELRPPAIMQDATLLLSVDVHHATVQDPYPEQHPFSVSGDKGSLTLQIPLNKHRHWKSTNGLHDFPKQFVILDTWFDTNYWQTAGTKGGPVDCFSRPQLKHDSTKFLMRICSCTCGSSSKSRKKKKKTAGSWCLVNSNETKCKTNPK